MSRIFIADMNGTAARLLSARSREILPFEKIKESSGGGVCVIEISDARPFDPEFAREARGRGCDVVAVAESASSEVFESLRTNGIARFLDYATLATWPAIPAWEGAAWERILLIDDDHAFGGMLASIGGLFGYTVERIVDGQTAMERMKDNHAFVIHNLSLENLDLMDFIRRTAGTRLSSTPYLAFLRDGSQVSLRELHSGIGRLTKTIMTRDEILSVLSYNLSMSEFHSRMDEASRGAASVSSATFASERVRGIFFANKDIFFHGRAASESASVLGVAASIDRARESLAKLASLKWLIADHDE